MLVGVDLSVVFLLHLHKQNAFLKYRRQFRILLSVGRGQGTRYSGAAVLFNPDPWARLQSSTPP